MMKRNQIHRSTDLHLHEGDGLSHIAAAFRRILPHQAMAIGVVMVVAGCGREDPIAPPQVHFGQDVCDVCHMIISDERYAAGVVTEDDRGRRTRLAFDDIGCIFELERQQPQRPIAAVFVRDFNTKEWLNASQAVFVHSRDLHTPMAFGLAALSDRASAESVHDEFGGDIIELDEARDRFERGVLHVESIDVDGAGRAMADDAQAVLELDDGRTIRLVLISDQQQKPGTHAFEVEVSRWQDCGHWFDTDAYSLHIEPEMPSMGHGSPGNEHPQHIENGLYRGLVNFTMSGDWVVHVTVLEGNTPVGKAAFDFEVQP